MLPTVLTSEDKTAQMGTQGLVVYCTTWRLERKSKSFLFLLLNIGVVNCPWIVIRAQNQIGGLGKPLDYPFQTWA